MQKLLYYTSGSVSVYGGVKLQERSEVHSIDSGGG